MPLKTPRKRLVLLVVLYNCSTGSQVGFGAGVVARFGVEVTSHFVLFIVALVCTGTTAGYIGNLHEAPAVQ